MMRRVAAVSLLLFAAAFTTFAQSQRGTIVGTITDATGAVVPDAKVEVVHSETNAKFEALANQNGYYNVPYLPYGKYTLRVTVPGFKVYSITGVEVATATTSTVNVSLSVEAQTQEVQVQANAVILEATTSSVGTSVEEKLKDDLPVANRRNALSYLQTVPGYQPTNQTTLAGGRYGSNNILLDGQSPDVTITSQGDFGNPSLPSVEMIGEFKALLNSVPAEYGRTGGPTISFATRSGTNEFHGAAYEYYSNEDYNARPWQAATRPTGSGHYYGVAGGGPVVIPKLYDGRNRTFFFADYSDIRSASTGGATGITSVATEAMRRGDFSASDLLPIYDVLNQTRDSAGNIRYLQFAGNQIPQTRLSRVSKFFLDKIPAPTRPGSINNFVGVLPPQSQTQWLFAIKGDHYLSSKDRLSGYFQASRPESLTSDVLGESFGNANLQRFNRGRLDWSRNFTASLSHQLMVGVTRVYAGSQSRNFGQNLGASAGLTGLFDGNCPRIEINRAQEGSFNLCFNLANITATTNTTVNYSMMYVRRAHSFKWGVEYVKFNINNNARSDTITNAAGAFNFGGLNPRPSVSPIGQNATSQTDNTGGNSWADFYLGLPKVAYAASPVILGLRQGYFAAFIQDDWRITPRLTLNLGLRWDLNVPYSEVNGQFSRFDIDTPNPGASGRPGALVYHGIGPGRTGSNSAGDYHFKSFGPRLGFAYQLNPKTVVRGFAGILYHSTQNTNVNFAERTGFQASGEPLIPENRFSVYYNWDQPFPQNVLGRVPNTDPSFRNGQLVQAQDPGGVSFAPSSYMWSLSIQRELPKAWMLDLSYIANNMKHGTDRLELNFLPERYWNLGPLLDLPFNDPRVQALGIPLPFAGFSPTQPLYQALRPFPQYQSVAENATNGTSSNYNAVMIKVQKRFAGGLSFLGNYTASKFITDSQWAAGGFGAFPTVANNRALDKGLYRFDIPQRLVLSYSYDLPFGKGKRFLNKGRALDLAVGGWNITGIQQYQSGWPAAFAGSFNTAIPTIASRANRVANVPTRSNIGCGDVVFGDPSRNYLFNAGNPQQAARTGRPLAFTPSGDYAIGNTPRIDPEARQCGRMDEAITIFKSFNIFESVRFRFGAEAYNLLNRHTWESSGNGQPVTAANFGEVIPVQPFGPRTIRLKFRMEW